VAARMGDERCRQNRRRSAPESPTKGRSEHPAYCRGCIKGDCIIPGAHLSRECVVIRDFSDGIVCLISRLSGMSEESTRFVKRNSHRSRAFWPLPCHFRWWKGGDDAFFHDSRQRTSRMVSWLTPKSAASDRRLWECANPSLLTVSAFSVGQWRFALVIRSTAAMRAGPGSIQF
jgi:hypothetical protein